ncbi:PAN domain-containing protein [Ditylenchus destructor]|uniref:PAN domain-containing protein n=1 Tax=Ditylenchus destructor TaxID=166010 RepID=A0AAD4NKU9_9BILA|nr:PAN domain-containing protein [Ditylenchus destructor]
MSPIAQLPEKVTIYLLLLPSILQATTEWFGDLRAHLNPVSSPAFYDVTYDDSECPMGLQSNAIPNFVYFGEMIGTKSVKEHSTCLQLCLTNSRCKAVNFFEPISKKETGFCELLSESQYDNPRLMRPFRKAVYYEKIHCLTSDDDFDFTTTSSRHETKKSVKSDEASTQLPFATLSDLLNVDITSTTPAGDSSTTQKITASKIQGHQRENFDGKKQTSNKILKKEEAMSALKKLMAKIHEFNMRFRSR